MNEFLPYNTQQEPVSHKEYGRNVKRLVEKINTFEDPVVRNDFASMIVNLMAQMHPNLRNLEEFRQKLWDQVHIISGHTIDIEVPYSAPQEIPEDESGSYKLRYTQSRLRFRHYGKNVERLIAKAIEMEDEEKRHSFAKIIAGYMKMVYKNWNSDGVSDEAIRADLLLLSEGLLDLGDNVSLEEPKQSRPQSNFSRRKSNDSGRRSGGRDDRGSRGRSNNYRSRSNDRRNRR